MLKTPLKRMAPVEGLSFPVGQTSNSLSLLEISVSRNCYVHTEMVSVPF